MTVSHFFAMTWINMGFTGKVFLHRVCGGVEDSFIPDWLGLNAPPSW